ncbi:MAG: hypothetical protein A2W91_03935 [Bacteroidetes bacterium GWF2_38_335]|nr:MAG: hypothetical protein A2W91_03935 [Bacteroidetes bacterium GWF2_38_335]OFY79102.1 MAG: hypothetical protein A2281_03270 [Bacteroidetes bacterium RIFOXYA12_FULL_38_20]HBS88813.1 hypothetical protein [Bacteroidales bacterium]
MKIRNYIIAVVLSAVTVAFVSCNKQENKKEGEAEKQNVQVAIVDTADQNNNFYDNEETFELKTSELEVVGEIKNPGKVDFSKLPVHSVIVKETLLKPDGDTFIGAYRYDGYSLFDILSNFQLDKKNAEDFRPIIDLYVEIENAKGEKVVLTWGEIFYPNHLHEIIIANGVMRIVPSKTKELWSIPESSRLVVSSDLITERNISSPVKITVKSFDINLKVEKGKTPLFSDNLNMVVNGDTVANLKSNPQGLQIQKLHTIFYGRGRGIHSTTPFTGTFLKEFVAKFVTRTKESLQTGLFVVAADDGYRSVYSYSEVCNRNDQADILLVFRPEEKEDAVFRTFPSCDFFSDRAVKAITDIYYFGK